ncbi:tyrosine-type recombinase/integrase [Candidatus Eisenbacteria bacterium]|uniref:Tyrosine-type recombinase/integrase n=1 Tax=Eiseniibacteriota bacterium TaxID=2212470 RepID=A0ABV6YKY1_UNCEI
MGGKRMTERVAKFTDRKVRSLKAREQRYIVWGPNGLGIRISPPVAGRESRKTWIFMYRLGRKARQQTLGHYPKMTVAEAHTVHWEAVTLHAQGLDPAQLSLEKRRAERNADTVEELVEAYVERYAKPNKKSWKDDARILRKEVVSAWRGRLAKDIRRRDIVELLDGIVPRAPIMANRTLAVVRKLFNWALSRDILQNSPCTQVERPAPEKERSRFLSPGEVRALLLGLRNPKMPATDATRNALLLLLATGQRPGEVARAQWSEFDLEDGWWTIPGERAKNGLSHRVPLNSVALSALRAAQSTGKVSPWVFPTPDGSRACRPLSLNRAIRRGLETLGISHFTPQDLRRTAATHLASLGVSRFVLARILNHVEKGITRVYDRHTYDGEKQEALEAWGDRLEELGRKGEARDVSAA